MDVTKEELSKQILSLANFDALKAKRDEIMNEIKTLEQRKSNYYNTANEEDKTIKVLSDRIKSVFISGDEQIASELISQRLFHEAKCMEIRNAATEIRDITLPNIQKKLHSFNQEIDGIVRNATEECRNSFLQVIDKKMRALDQEILSWQEAVKTVGIETAVLNLFAGYKWILLKDDGTRYVTLSKMKG